MPIFTQSLRKVDMANPSEAIKSMANHIRYIQEQLEYTLMNLDSSNIISIDTDDTQLSGSSVDSIPSLIEAVNGISSTVSEHSGGIASLQHTVNGLSSTVESQSGQISTMEQSASHFAVTVSDTLGMQLEGVNMLQNAEWYQASTPYSVTPTSDDHYEYLSNDFCADLVAGETYTIQCTTDGLWSTHGVVGNRYCTIWLTNANREFHYYFGGDGTETGTKSWTFTPEYTGEHTIRVNAYGAGNSTVRFWNFKIEKGSSATDWTPYQATVADSIYHSLRMDANGVYVVDGSGNKVTISKGNLSLTGAIYWADLGTDAQGQINTANSNANSALSISQQIANGTYSGGTFIDGTKIYSPTIYGNTFNVMPRYTSDTSGSFNIYGYYGQSLFQFLSIQYYASTAPYVNFTSPGGAYAQFNFSSNQFYGKVCMHSSYGSSLPSSGATGEVFFLI